MTQTTTSAKTAAAADQAAATPKPDRTAGKAMGTGSISSLATTRATPRHLLRLALLAVALVVLLAVSFVVGRATADTTPAHGPAAVTATAGQTSNYICRVGRPC